MLCILWLVKFDPINGIGEICVRESIPDPSKISLLAERDMIDHKGIVKTITLHHEVHSDICKSVLANVEVSWYSDCFYETF